MSTYSLVFHVFDENAERTGETIRLATVSDGEVKGKMRRIVEQRLALGVVQIGITGPIVNVTVNDPDLLAYSLANRSADLWDAGVIEDGIVVAVDDNDVEIPFRYANEPPMSDLLGTEDQEDVEPIPLD